MQFILAGISMLIFFALTLTLSQLNLGGWLKAAIIIPLVLLVVYSMARIMPKETTSKKIPGNNVLQKSANALLHRQTSGSPKS